MIPAKFTWDDAGEFAGFYDPAVDWNGWACPYFERKEVERIIAYDEKNNNGNKWFFDNNFLYWLDTSTLEDEGDANNLANYEMIAPIIHDGKELWAVGAWYWTWSVVEK